MTRPFRVSFFELVELFYLLCTLVAVEDVFSPLAVDFDEALELFVLNCKSLDDVLRFAVDFKASGLHVWRAVIAREVGEAHCVALAVVHRKVALADLDAAEFFRYRLADRDLRQLHRHIVKARLENEDLLLEGVEVADNALADVAQVAVFFLELLVTELEALDFRNEINHKTVLHIIVKNRVGEARVVGAGRARPREQLAVEHLFAVALVPCNVDAGVDFRFSELAAHRAYHRFVDLVF